MPYLESAFTKVGVDPDDITPSEGSYVTRDDELSRFRMDLTCQGFNRRTFLCGPYHWTACVRFGV